MILGREAVVEIGGVRHPLKADDTTWIPAGLPHRFLNEGDGRMRIFWTYADVGATRTMVETGAEQSIDDEHEKAKKL